MSKLKDKYVTLTDEELVELVTTTAQQCIEETKELDDLRRRKRILDATYKMFDNPSPAKKERWDQLTATLNSEVCDLVMDIRKAALALQKTARTTAQLRDEQSKRIIERERLREAEQDARLDQLFGGGHHLSGCHCSCRCMCTRHCRCHCH